MRTYNYILFLIALCFVAASASAQRRVKKAEPVVVETPYSETVAAAYLDSLKMYRQKIDSLMAANDSLRAANGYAADNKYYRFFAAPTYYPDVVGNRLVPGGKNAGVEDDALMSLYFKRPDLVAYSADRLRSLQSDNASAADPAVPQQEKLTQQVKAPVPVKEAEVVADKSVDLYVAKPNFWKFTGDYYLQFMQNYLTENWYKSGSNNYSMLGSVTLQYNYNNKQKIKWDNKLEMKLGFMTSESDTVNKFRSSEDLIRYTGKFGVQAHKNWYYTAQVIANTQFTRGLKENNKKVFSDFMSPFNLNVSLGMDYVIKTNNGKLTGNAHLAPLAYNLKYVDRADLAKSFGIEENHVSLSDFGSQFTIDLLWKPLEMLQWKARIYGYTTYHKVEFECENTITFKFNKYISTNVFLYPRFDDGVARKDGFSYWMFKEYVSLGFSYSM